MTEPCILAIDLGTTNCKTILLDAECHIVAKRSVEYAVATPRPGWAEQDPHVWWEVVKESIRDVAAVAAPGAIQAIGISGQMHGLVALNAQGQVIRPAILWNDQRSAPQCDEIYALAGGREGLCALTNNPMLPGYTGGKILWLRQHEPAHYNAIATIMLPKDYIRYRLTGTLGTDVSDASGTGLFDVRRRRWSSELLALLDLPARWFPHSHESADVVGEVDADVAREVGLGLHIPVVAGGGDAVMQTLGAGAVNSDVALVVIGTGGNVTVSLAEPMENPEGKLQLFCHVAPRRWVAMGVTLSAGNSLKWYRDALGGMEKQMAHDLQQDTYALLDAQAALSPATANGLIFLPYLQGERCPHTDVDARGVLFGLGLQSSKSDIIRGIMEGVTFSLRDVLELIQQAGFDPQTIRASGGGSTSALWRQIQADIFGREVTTLRNSEDAGAIGAGIIGGLAAGFWPTVDAAVALLPEQTRDMPIAANVPTYDRQFALYKSLYPVLKSAFASRQTQTA